MMKLHLFTLYISSKLIRVKCLTYQHHMHIMPYNFYACITYMCIYVHQNMEQIRRVYAEKITTLK